MPWLHTQTCALPEQDVVSFAFGNRDYDPDKPIVHDLDNPNRTLSWNQARSLVRKLVAGFRKAGLKKGDCFSITSFNDMMYSMCFLGGIGAGGIFSGTNPAYKELEIRHHIHTAHVKFFIVEPELFDSIRAVVEKEGILQDRIFIFNTRGQPVPNGFRSWEWLLEQGEEDWNEITDLDTLKTTEICRLTTSGTTGLPKVAMQSHYNATSYHTMTNALNQTPWQSRNLMPLPMFHVASVPAVHISPLRSGNPCWIMRRFDLESFLSSVERLQITDLGLVPPLVIAIIMSPLSKKYSLKSVRQVRAGAAPLDAHSQNRLVALCAPGATFTQVTGMTETTSTVCMFPWPQRDDTGSVGSQFLPNTDVKLVDDSGKDITDFDVRGELCIRGPTVIRGYYDNPKANKESWDKDGYFHTGDIMYFDSKAKKWYIVDRKKELIKVRGFQVAPPELEGVLLTHHNIVDAAVIGVRLKGDNQDESPRAYVVRRPGTHITEQEVKSVISTQLASYKALTGGVVFVDEIPKLASGKILKRVLREQADKELSGKAKL